MKATLTLIAVFFFSYTTVAQNGRDLKVETNKVTVELNTVSEEGTTLEKEVARLYMFKNSRIKKELSFKTKRNRAKLA